MEQLAHRVHVAQQKRLLHLEGLALEAVERLDGARLPAPVARGLALDDARAGARLPQVAQQHPVLELAQHVGPDAQRVHDRGVALELDEVEPAEGRRVLVLEAALDPEVLALDPVGELGNLVVRQRKAPELLQEADERDAAEFDLVERARQEGVAVIENESANRATAAVAELVLSAAERAKERV